MKAGTITARPLLTSDFYLPTSFLTAGEAVKEEVEGRPRRVVLERTAGQIMIEGILRLDLMAEHSKDKRARGGKNA